MGYEGNWQPDQSQSSDACHRSGITHDQVYTERHTQRTTRRNDDCVTINGDIYLGDAPNSQRQTSRYD